MNGFFASGRVVDLEEGSGAIANGNGTLIIVALVAAIIGIIAIVFLRRSKNKALKKGAYSKHSKMAAKPVAKPAARPAVKSAKATKAKKHGRKK